MGSDLARDWGCITEFLVKTLSYLFLKKVKDILNVPSQDQEYILFVLDMAFLQVVSHDIERI